MCFGNCLPFHGNLKNPSINRSRVQGILIADSRPIALWRPKHWPRTLAGQFPGVAPKWKRDFTGTPSARIALRHPDMEHLADAPAPCGGLGKDLMIHNSQQAAWFVKSS